MKCAVCDEEHEMLFLSPVCHPGRPLEVTGIQHPNSDEVLLEMRCAKCSQHVAYFMAKRVYMN